MRRAPRRVPLPAAAAAAAAKATAAAAAAAAAAGGVVNVVSGERYRRAAPRRSRVEEIVVGAAVAPIRGRSAQRRLAPRVADGDGAGGAVAAELRGARA